jgi:hypothetical protein
MDYNTELEIIEESLVSNKAVKQIVHEFVEQNRYLDSIQRLQLNELQKNL